MNLIKVNTEIALKSLLANRQRTILALLGIIIGIGSFIAMVSAGVIVREFSAKRFLALGTDYFSISKGWSGNEDAKILPETVTSLKRRIPEIKDVCAIGLSGGTFSYRGQEYRASLIAPIGNFFSLNRIKVQEGRLISDFDKGMPYCVIGQEIVKQLKKNDVKRIVGADIRFNGTLLTIVGILEEVPEGGMSPFNANRSMIIPYSTYEVLFEDSEISNVIGRLKEGSNIQSLVEDIQSYFKLRSPGIELEIRTAEQLIKAQKEQYRTTNLLLGIIGSISLIVGGVGVMNVMLVSVAERKKEIGIRRALGALRRDIQFQFLTESLVLCLVGGTIGIVFGILVSYFVAHSNGWDFILSSSAIVLGVAVSTLVGIFFGYYPARQAAMLDPIVALRS